jgi:ATP-binding cassette subfamily B protein/ATP-binding cassette subfamily C protein
VLLGLLPLQAGAIYWNDRKVDDPANFFVPPRSAYTPQVPKLFSTSLRENILLGLEKPDFDIQNAIAMAVFERDVADLDSGLETCGGVEGCSTLWRTITACGSSRMFVHQPELLVFDDLSSALDVETEQTLWSRLFAQGRFQPRRTLL